eukprot:Polyplicarium_translucidae@DN895_c0_g1_i1.p3
MAKSSEVRRSTYSTTTSFVCGSKWYHPALVNLAAAAVPAPPPPRAWMVAPGCRRCACRTDQCTIPLELGHCGLYVRIGTLWTACSNWDIVDCMLELGHCGLHARIGTLW